MRLDSNYGADPDYVRSSFRKVTSGGPTDVAHDEWTGSVANFTSVVMPEDFEQPRELWALFKMWGQDGCLIDNLIAHLKKALPRVQRDTIAIFSKVDPEIGQRLEAALGDFLGEKGVDHVSGTPYGLQPAYGGGY